MEKHFYINGEFKMTLFDISRELLGAEVYPGDPKPERTVISSVSAKDEYTVSEISLSSHSATHIDAPSHVIDGGMTVDEIPLYMTVGLCTVVEYSGIVDKVVAEELLAKISLPEFNKRLIFKGDVSFTPDGATHLSNSGVYLVGVSSLSVGDIDIHRAFLSGGTIILEGLSLSGIDEGFYMLNAAPICIEGGDGAPCRALLHKI